jgi:hypothetical protein
MPNTNTRYKIVGTSNVKPSTGVTYIATADGGDVQGAENILIDGAISLAHSG